MKAVKGEKRASNFTNKRLDKEHKEGEERIKAKWAVHYRAFLISHAHS